MSFQRLSQEKKTSLKHRNEYKNHLGESIEKRPKIVDRRFFKIGIDTVIGKNVASDNASVRKMLSLFSDKQAELFKTITTDNGLEFASLSEFDSEKTSIYFPYPYVSYERYNKIIRRFNSERGV